LPRRKSTNRREEPLTDKKPGDQDIASAEAEQGRFHTDELTSPPTKDAGSQPHHRVISQSMQSGQIPIPTVTFVDNQHILPRSFLQPTIGSSDRIRSYSDAGVLHTANDEDATPTSGTSLMSRHRPSLEDRHANSWGATTVNKRLRNEVFNDAFLKQPIMIQKHQRPASHQRSIPRRSVQPVMRSHMSDLGLDEIKDLDEITGHGRRALTRPSGLRLSYGPVGDEQELSQLQAEDMGQIKDVTGTSAPEPEL
jgi:inositol-hexakisphosphate 5-kinase